MPQQVVKAFAEFRREDFARVGARATEDFDLPSGPVAGPTGQPLPHTLEPTLRKYAMPCNLNKGVIEISSDFSVRT